MNKLILGMIIIVHALSLNGMQSLLNPPAKKSGVVFQRYGDPLSKDKPIVSRMAEQQEKQRITSMTTGPSSGLRPTRSSSEYGSIVLPEIDNPELGFEMVEAPEMAPDVKRLSSTMAGSSSDDALITFNPDGGTEKCIGLICIHGTFSTNKGMGADANRAFSDALQTFAKKLAKDKQATVRMIIPQWSGQLSTEARTQAAHRIHKELEDLHKECPFSELYGIGHSHGCNVLLTLSTITTPHTPGTLDVRNSLKTMTLIAPPRIEVPEIYNYPPHCFVYDFYSLNDATQQGGSLERGQGFEQKIPIRTQDIGKVYNILVENLPIVGNPHHKSIKHVSLIDCLPAIYDFIESTYKNYADLRLWITEVNNKYRPALALNNASLNNETNPKNQQIAELTSANVIEYLCTNHADIMQRPRYLLHNLLFEIFYKDPTVDKK